MNTASQIFQIYANHGYLDALDVALNRCESEDIRPGIDGRMITFPDGSAIYAKHPEICVLDESASK